MAFDRSMLGFKVKDVVTGFEGTCASVHHYMNGCTRVGIEPHGLEKGEPVSPHIFDENRVEILEERSIPVPAHQLVAQAAGVESGPGGPTDSRDEV